MPDQALDPYYYARDHERGGWCVRGPDGFDLTVPGGLDKNDAYIIGKVLSGRYAEAADLARAMAGMFGNG
jgi:hypothetical protein